MKQLMSPLSESRLKLIPVLHFLMVDLYSPINVQGCINKTREQTMRKTGFHVTCLTTRLFIGADAARSNCRNC